MITKAEIAAANSNEINGTNTTSAQAGIFSIMPPFL
jgi:hypothetical protein